MYTHVYISLSFTKLGQTKKIEDLLRSPSVCHTNCGIRPPAFGFVEETAVVVQGT